MTAAFSSSAFSSLTTFFSLTTNFARGNEGQEGGRRMLRGGPTNILLLSVIPEFVDKHVELELVLFKLENLRLEVINEARDEHTFNMRPINLVVALNSVGELFEGKARAGHGQTEELRGESSGKLRIAALEVVGELVPSLANVAEGKLFCDVAVGSSGGYVQNLPKNETTTDDWIGWIILALIL